MAQTISETPKIVAVIRLRGTPGLQFARRDTLAMLRLHKPHHVVLIPLTSAYQGMLTKLKDVVTWGEVSSETVERLLSKKGRITGNEKLTDEWIKGHVEGAGTIKELASKLSSGELKMKDIKGLKPLFRLHPARKGYRRFKRNYNDGGALGFRGPAINELLVRMS